MLRHKKTLMIECMILYNKVEIFVYNNFTIFNQHSFGTHHNKLKSLNEIIMIFYLAMFFLKAFHCLFLGCFKSEIFCDLVIFKLSSILF